MENVFSEAERREIAGRARLLHERLDGPPNEPGPEPPIEPDQLIAAWRDEFPTEEAFQSRLQREDISMSQIRDQIAATRWPADEPLPDWVAAVEELIRTIEGATDTAETTAADEDTRPFPELLEPVVESAVEQLPESELGTEVLSPVVSQLRSRVEMLCVRVLYVEFKSFVEYHDPELAAATPEAFDEPPTRYYEEFITAMREHGIRELFSEYPVLARQLPQLVDQWVRAVTELCRRLETDREAVKDRFDVSGPIKRVEPLTEDTHDGGRVPMRVCFESGAVVYKPRPVEGGVALYGILERLDEQLSTPSIEPPTYLARDGYGWMEEISYRDLPDADAADTYYQRAGVLIALSYSLNFIDSQLENVIAWGDTPILVDGETVCHPRVDPAEKPAQTELTKTIDESVLCTALLPWSSGDPHADKTGFTTSMAGFGARSGQIEIPKQTRPAIEGVNTDVMSVGDEPVEIGLRTNTPSIGDVDYSPGAHVDSILEGFETTYETIRRNHDAGEFLSTVVDSEELADIENRLVYRSTMDYMEILNSAVGRNPLRDGARMTVEYESLATPFFDGRTATDRYWELYQAERRALIQRDVPRFTSRGSQRTLSQNGTELEVTVDKSGCEYVRDRLDEMSVQDRKRQSWLIKSAFGGTIENQKQPPAADGAERAFQREARELFETACDAAIETEDGSGWLSLMPMADGVNLYSVGDDLYWGRGGIALTAAALAVATGDDRYRRYTDEVLDPILTAIRDGTVSRKLGGTRGLGSIIYTLSVVSDLRDETRYAERAQQAAELVTDERLARDTTFDIMEGAAGSLLGLLATYERFGGSTVLDRAIACGDRLLDARTEIDGYRVWATNYDDTVMTGFAHGTSGIAYALSRLAAVTSESKYADAAREALEYESSLYVPSQRNWPQSNAASEPGDPGAGATHEGPTTGNSEKDTPSGQTHQDRWCHGRTGMALSRLGIADQLDDSALRDEAEAVLAATVAGEPSHLDNVCCGNAGRIEALHLGSRRADIDPTAAVALARRCLTRRASEGSLSLPGHSQSFTNPTFFDGVTGVAYTLLRLQHPESLPCALLLE